VSSYDSICSDIALKSGFAVVFPEYTLAPEVRFPTQQEQCYAVVKWVHEHGVTLGLRQQGFAIVGDAAGGKFNRHRPVCSLLLHINRCLISRDT
jgi:acetyl esterase